MNSTSNDTDVFNAINENHVSSMNCPNFTSEDINMLNHAKYWVGGVSACAVSFTGIILNITAVCVLLTRLSNRNNFNQLIVLLFLVDTMYLILSVLTTLQIRLGIENRTLTMIFPKFTYPVWSISLTLSIFLTVGVTHERYIAIKYPIIHRQRMRSAKYRRFNLLKYIVCVMLCAALFNVPKFFEIEIGWHISSTTKSIQASER